MSDHPATDALCRELVRRGWFVTAAETGPHTVLIGFNFLPGKAPTWLKAFEVPLHLATPESVETMIETWKAGVRWDLENGRPSQLVRQMIAEHGPERVAFAMAGGVHA